MLHLFELLFVAYLAAGIQAELRPVAPSGVNSSLTIDYLASWLTLSGAARDPVNFWPLWRSGRISSDLDAEEEKIYFPLKLNPP